MSSAARPAGQGAPYFVDQKKGEVNELRQLLRTVGMQRDLQKMRDALKKVVAYMTLGIDVSRLFGEVVLVRKKPGLPRGLPAPRVLSALYSPGLYVLKGFARHVAGQWPLSYVLFLRGTPSRPQAIGTTGEQERG